MTRRYSHRYARRDFSKLLLGTATAGLMASPGLAAPTTAPTTTGTQSDRPFVMDVHIHMAQPGVRPRSEVLAELYRPWKYVYGADGEWIPKPTDLHAGSPSGVPAAYYTYFHYAVLYSAA